MAKGVALSKEFLNYLKFSIDESAAATFTEKELDTNLSAERGVMMEIHSFEFFFDNAGMFREVAAGGQELIGIQITRDSKTGMVMYDDSDLLIRHEQVITRSTAIGTDAGPLYVKYDADFRVFLPLPLPFVKNSIFVGILSTFASAGSATGRIGYTLREISREDFLELLVAVQ